jgi:hypothetical protein
MDYGYVGALAGKQGCARFPARVFTYQARFWGLRRGSSFKYRYIYNFPVPHGRFVGADARRNNIAAVLLVDP